MASLGAQYKNPLNFLTLLSAIAPKYSHHKVALAVAMSSVNERPGSVAGWERLRNCFDVLGDFEGREWAEGMAESGGRDDGGTFRTVS